MSCILGETSLKVFLSVLNFLLLKKFKGFTNYDEIHNFERKLSLPCLLKIRDVTDTLTNGDIHFIAYFSCNYQTFDSKYSCCTFAVHSRGNY